MSEPSYNPPKKKFQHVYQDEKWHEKWPFLKTRTITFCHKEKQMQCVTDYRISTIDKHIHTQHHQDAIREEGLWLGDTVLFTVYELFTLTITSISILKTRLIRTAINSAIF